MWIRSQDKERLIKAVCIYLCGENHTKYLRYASVEGDRWYIGKYSTKEKALKVLDEIQKIIKERSCMIISLGESSKCHKMMR
jgi:excinuclease UvrABC nuclease subunit